MGQHVSRTDFEWTYTAEPHASRRKEILKKHPEIKELFGNDPNLKWWVLGLVTFQVLSLFVVKDLPWLWVFLLAYCIGGTINHSLMLAIHEISHNLAFGHSQPLANRFLGIFANFPIALPFSVSFKGYHLEHHKYQGDEKLDTDIPTSLEARLFCTTFGKLIWMSLQPLFYALRPVITYPKTPTLLEIFNTAVQLSFNFAVYYFFGAKGISYLAGGSLLAMGIHPVAGHFISEHYMFHKGFETYSYYGPLNYVTFNVGYHNEHHDFPYVPGSRLPKVRALAPEYYDDLPRHESWVKVIYDFITDPAIGPYARIKRKHAKLLKEE
ncbi:sphingolipid delta(4)-desaturase DES1-like isoform X1 [Eriocheir sinensis]|uniref:sphingolipid delta(4)-desaturase DES1-like isoform X1 n=1 Tax=Eriocheir sinensis TaxID=95602 RepID=UPI0021C84F05|nr:sphingolipid delta(4)-desaturase DES1-like isoform X1 [Eriocheir sinensis]